MPRYWNAGIFVFSLWASSSSVARRPGRCRAVWEALGHARKKSGILGLKFPFRSDSSNPQFIDEETKYKSLCPRNQVWQKSTWQTWPRYRAGIVSSCHKSRPSWFQRKHNTEQVQLPVLSTVGAKIYRWFSSQNAICSMCIISFYLLRSSMK